MKCINGPCSGTEVELALVEQCGGHIRLRDPDYVDRSIYDYKPDGVSFCSMFPTVDYHCAFVDGQWVLVADSK